MNAPLTSLDNDIDGQALSVIMHARHRRRRVVAAVAVVAAAATGVGIAVYGNDGSKNKNPAATVPTGLATVKLGTLIARTSVSGTLTYAGSYKAINQATGPVTALPGVGQVIHQGRMLYMVNGKPVTFLKGDTTPMYRDLSEYLTGPDVAQLNAALADSGFGSAGDLSKSGDKYTWVTAAAVRKLQAALGVTKTGTLSRGDLLFIGASQIRVTKVDVQLGDQAPPGGVVLEASSTSRMVSVDVDVAMQAKIKVGDQVSITLPNGGSTNGTVSSGGSVVKTGTDGTSTINIQIAPQDSAATGTLDQAPVGVSITTDSVKDALMVPINALLALLGGGYGVEVVDASGAHRIIPVQLGLFDDSAGMVQISGSQVSAGQKVVVPA